MIEAISTIPLAMYLAFTGFISDLKKDDRGLSGVVVAVLLILVAVLAIVLIWVFLRDWLEDLWDRITSQSAGVS